MRTAWTVFFALLLLPAQVMACPEGYAPIPADYIYIKRSWCLSVHEMRNVDGRAVSSGEGEPWHLAHNPARAECQKLGYDLPSNDLWQSMARNAELIAENWTGGAVGEGELKGSVLVWNRRGGTVFHNVGDSVWEQIRDTLPGDPQLHSIKIKELTDQTYGHKFLFGNDTRAPKAHFGPIGIYDGARLGITSLYGNTNIMRGGDDQNPGMFGLAMNHGPDADSNADDVGFRCACPRGECYQPPPYYSVSP